MWRYKFDFIAFPGLAVLLVGLFCRSWTWVGWFLAGIVLFTFLEYWVHRIILHKVMWHSTHQRHHTYPNEKVIFPLWYTPGIFLGFALVLPLPVFAGLVTGYCWFLVWHHALHQWHLDTHPWVKTYARWHNFHHSGLPVNYGITHPGWDFVFGTYKAAR